LKFNAGLKVFFGGGGCEFGPWAGGKTVITAIDPVAHLDGKLWRNQALMLNCEVGNTLSGVKLTRLIKSIGWAGTEARTA